MGNLVDDFLESLAADKQQPRQSNSIDKMLMSSRDNQGTVVFAPFLDTYSKKFYLLINSVKEYKTVIPTYKDGNDEVWVKILPKEFYGDLTAEQSALYDQVIGLFDQVDEAIGDVPNKWNIIRTRSYSLFQGVIINQINTQGAKVSDHINKPAILIYPSRNPINELANAMNNKIASMGNSKEWIPAVFAPTDKGREGVVTIMFTKPNSPGYDCSVSFEFNSNYAKVIDPEAGFPEEVVKSFGNSLEMFLGWQNGKSGRFNDENFAAIRDILTIRLKSAQKGKPAEIPIENHNGQDPMLQNNGSVNTASPALEGDNAQPANPAPSAASGGTEVELPF